MDRQTSFDRILATTYDIADPGAQHRLLAEIAALLNSHCANLAVLRRDELLFGSWHGFPDYRRHSSRRRPPPTSGGTRCSRPRGPWPSAFISAAVT